MSFTICYRHEGAQVIIQYPGDDLCGHDAVYYSLLHSGVALREGLSNWVGSYGFMLQSANQFGVTDVKWCRSDLATA
jgi:hypothetical protein